MYHSHYCSHFGPSLSEYCGLLRSLLVRSTIQDRTDRCLCSEMFHQFSDNMKEAFVSESSKVFFYKLILFNFAKKIHRSLCTMFFSLCFLCFMAVDKNLLPKVKQLWILRCGTHRGDVARTFLCHFLICTLSLLCASIPHLKLPECCMPDIYF